jgi:zona occludens toxin (predicted ATPase)
VIYLYSGTPGSFKSYHAIRDIKFKLEHGGNVIANFPVDTKKLKSKNMGKFIYKQNDELTYKFLVDFALKNHKKGKEAQTLLIIDECQGMFNPREYQRKDRKDYNTFFSQHRKLGYNIILVTQNDRLIDRQIRCQLEYEVKHRKVNNYKIFMFLPFKLCACITYWYGVREKVSTEFFIFNKRIAQLYDSYELFSILDDINKSDENEKKILPVINIKKKKDKDVDFVSCSDDGFGGEGVPGSGTEQETNNESTAI